MLLLPQNAFFTRVAKDFETAYTYFLLDRRLIDTPVVKVAFYTACEKMVKEDPIPGDAIMQAAILKHLSEIKNNALNDYLESVELIFSDVAASNGVSPN